MIKLINDDCMNIMKKYEDNHFDLAICDPPYGIGNFIPTNISKEGKKASKKVEWNDKTPNKKYFKELKRVSKKQIIWGANYYNCFENGASLVWYKGSINPIFSQCEIASLSFGKKVDYVHINWQGGFYRTLKEGKQIHPCQKPQKLYEWLLQNYSEKGQKILDTHLGSGSIAIACHYFGVDLVGIEIDGEYYKAAKDRIDKMTRQETLF